MSFIPPAAGNISDSLQHLFIKLSWKINFKIFIVIWFNKNIKIFSPLIYHKNLV